MAEVSDKLIAESCFFSSSVFPHSRLCLPKYSLSQAYDSLNKFLTLLRTFLCMLSSECKSDPPLAEMSVRLPKAEQQKAASHIQ